MGMKEEPFFHPHTNVSFLRFNTPLSSVYTSSLRTSDVALKVTLTEKAPLVDLRRLALDLDEASPFTGFHSPFTWWYSASAPEASTSSPLATLQQFESVYQC